VIFWLACPAPRDPSRVRALPRPAPEHGRRCRRRVLPSQRRSGRQRGRGACGASEPRAWHSWWDCNRRVEGSSGSTRLHQVFPRSCGLDSREDAESGGRNEVLCFPPLPSLIVLPCYQSTDVSSHLLGMGTILRGSLGLPVEMALFFRFKLPIFTRPKRGQLLPSHCATSPINPDRSIAC
jgi:hypothetical protein